MAAGSNPSSDPDNSNKRTATVKSSGFGPYTVIVQNNSRVPATYDLRQMAAFYIDDSARR